MTAALNVNTSGKPKPRPFLAIVTALGLDDVVVPKASKCRSNGKKGGAAVAANDGSIPVSGRNNALASFAGTLRRKGMSSEAIDVALQAKNLAQCRPPLDRSEVSSIATSIGRYPSANADDILKTLTDTGNADRFGRQHEADAMYVFGMRWFIWSGFRWQRDEVDQVVELAKQVARDIYAEGDIAASDEARIAVAKHAKASQQVQRIDAMLKLARSLHSYARPWQKRNQRRGFLLR